jgi:histidine ammonia-lyase
MGLNAALTAEEATGLAGHVLAALLIALSNAAALRDETRLSPGGKAFLAEIRAISPVLTYDRRLDGDLARLAAWAGNPVLPAPPTAFPSSAG